MKKTLPVLAVMGVAAIALAGCTDSAADPAPSGSEGSGGDGDLRTVRVAALPIAETGALWAADEAGIFAEHGLEIEIIPSQGGAQAIPALQNGDIDIAIGQPFGPFRASLAGLPIRVIGNYANSNAEGADVNSVVSGPDSGITDLADLSGKRVSVNSLGAAGDLTIMKAVDDAGGDSSTIEFVEVAFPEAPAQLDSGNIDAAWVPDPFRNQIVDAGGTDLVYPYQATIPGLTVLTNITSTEVMESDPELIEDWSAALDDALAFATDNEDAVREAISANMEIPAEVVDGIVLPEFTGELDVDDLQSLVDLGVEYGVLDGEPNLDELIAE